MLQDIVKKEWLGLCSGCGSPPEATHLEDCPLVEAMQPLPVNEKRCVVCSKPITVMAFLSDDTCSVDCQKAKP